LASKANEGDLLLGIAWSTGIAVVISLLVLIAADGPAPRWAIVALGGIGFVSFWIVSSKHGWLRAPHPLGTPLRSAAILSLIGGFVLFLSWAAWPPIRRHKLDEQESALFKQPLKIQKEPKLEIWLACPSHDEKACVFAGQLTPLFGDAGWKIKNGVDRIDMNTPLEGIYLLRKGGVAPKDPYEWNSGGYFAINDPSLLTIQRAFQNIGIEPEGKVDYQLPENTMLIYVGTERADESKPTHLTETTLWVTGKKTGPFPMPPQ
jgi:hypothetical protein